MMKKQIVFVLLVSQILGNNVFGQAESFLTKEHTDYKISANPMPYRLFIPLNYEVNKKYPVVLFLHGAGERGSNNTSQLTANKGATIWTETNYQLKHPCFVIAPQCANNKQWVNASWSEGRSNQKTTPISEQLSLALSILDSLCKEYKIDLSRIYITGISMGGYGTWDAITRFPDKFAAAIPICGGGDSSRVHLIKNVPIRCFHSSDDPIVPVKGTRDMVKAINALGPNNRGEFYTEFTDKGHGCWNAAYSDSTVIDWLFHAKPVTINSSWACNITTIGGTIITKYNDSSTEENQDKIFDNLKNTKFLTNHDSTWVQFTTKNNSLFKISKFTIISGNDSPERDPKQIILKGSRDGKTWTIIDTEKITFNSRNQAVEYNINPALPYNNFKIEMCSPSATIMQLAEVKLFGIKMAAK